MKQILSMSLMSLLRNTHSINLHQITYKIWPASSLTRSFQPYILFHLCEITLLNLTWDNKLLFYQFSIAEYKLSPGIESLLYHSSSNSLFRKWCLDVQNSVRVSSVSPLLLELLVFRCFSERLLIKSTLWTQDQIHVWWWCSSSHTRHNELCVYFHWFYFVSADHFLRAISINTLPLSDVFIDKLDRDLSENSKL